MTASAKRTVMVGTVAGGIVLGSVLVAFLGGDEPTVARAATREAAAADEAATPARDWRPLVVREASSGNLVVDFPVRGPALGASPLTLDFAVDASGEGRCEVAVSPYLRNESGQVRPARLAAARTLRLGRSGGPQSFTASIPVSPCLDRGELGRLRLFIDSMGTCRVDPRSVVIRAPSEAPAEIEAAPGAIALLM